MSAFLSNAEFLIRYDARVTGQLVSDTGTAVSPGDLPTDTNLQTALEDASGEILTACLKGGRYSEDDLAGLSGNSLSYLQRLTCDLALYNLVVRRGRKLEDYPQTEKALEMLDQIQKGEKVFAVPAVIEAGVAQSPTLTIPDIANEHFLRDQCKMFPVRRWTKEQTG